MSHQEKLLFLQETRHVLGKTALVLSGGGSLGMYHNGIIKILSELDMLPKIVTGSSAGSVVAAYFFTKTKEEIKEVFNKKVTANMDGFKPENVGTFLQSLGRYLTKGYFFDSLLVLNSLKVNIGYITFLEAYERTGFILNITVTAYDKHSPSQVLNFLTSPHVVICSAVACSCSVPRIYSRSKLFSKDKEGNLIPYTPNGPSYVDGSFFSDVPLMRLAELFNVSNIIVSQTNPFMVPIKDLSQEMQYKNMFVIGILKTCDFFKNLVLKEIKHRISQLGQIGLIPHRSRKYLNLFNQEFVGNITIYPPIYVSRFLQILKNPTSFEEVEHFIINGAQQILKKINLIKASLALEIIVNNSYQNLMKQNSQSCNNSSQIQSLDTSDNQFKHHLFENIE